jgi:ABC-type enterochelin transport system substrate-binding protein
LVLLTFPSASFAQAQMQMEQSLASTAPAQEGAAMTITLQDALQRARLNDTQYRSAITDFGLLPKLDMYSRSFFSYQ